MEGRHGGCGPVMGAALGRPSVILVGTPAHSSGPAKSHITRNRLLQYA